MNKSLLKDAIALTVITLVAGCILGFVQMITKEPIAKQNDKIKQDAYREVFSEADSFQTIDGINPEKDAAKALSKEGLDKNNEIVEILSAISKDSSETIGYVMTITNKEAYDGELTFTMGIRSDGTVTGISFTDISETAGLGMKAKEDSFKDQFKEKKVESFQYTKSGAEKDEEIDALSGATITTNAVTNGVNAGIAYFRYVSGGAVNE